MVGAWWNRGCLSLMCGRISMSAANLMCDWRPVALWLLDVQFAVALLLLRN